LNIELVNIQENYILKLPVYIEIHIVSEEAGKDRRPGDRERAYEGNPIETYERERERVKW
jgi:hypothetical protein